MPQTLSLNPCDRSALICGVNGQDGAYLAQLLLGKGYRVWGTSRDALGSSFGNLERLGHAEPARGLSTTYAQTRFIFMCEFSIGRRRVRRWAFRLSPFAFRLSPLTFWLSMNLRSLAETVLPAPLYQRLSASSIAKRLARGSLWSLARSATSRLMVLLAMILVARVLGKESFGNSV